MDFESALAWLLPCVPLGLVVYAFVTGSIPVRRWMVPEGRILRSEHPVRFWLYIAMLLAIGGAWLSMAG
ncbi:MAG: hypothetical protein KUG77_19960 [Nannocystaceae bacterium]|nr:hypothetical protein [Nannocystaceae bacterium]